MLKNYPKCLKNIDFTELRTQKGVLLAVIDEMQKNQDIRFEELDGILNLIDSIQDFAVDEMGVPEMHVFDFELEEERDMTSVKKPEQYFKIVHQGFQKDLDREEIQIHGGENANIFLIKTPEGFVVDVYGQNELEDTMAIFEDSLTEDPIEVVLGKPEVVDAFMKEFKDSINKGIYAMPEEETNAPENFSVVEIREFKEAWGQTEDEICDNLLLDKETCTDVLMLDYFWDEEKKYWYPKSSSLYTPREQKIADYLRLG